MKSKELFNKLVDITSDVVEIDRERILSRSRDEDLVDARTVIAVMLVSEGFKPKQVAEILGYSKARTSVVLSNIPYKVKNDKMFKAHLDEVNRIYEESKVS